MRSMERAKMRRRRSMYDRELDGTIDVRKSTLSSGKFYLLFEQLGIYMDVIPRRFRKEVEERAGGFFYASVRLANHSFNLSSALPRCEILFFSLFSISAYVCPSYSKHESQPVSHQLFILFRKRHCYNEY